MKQLFNNRVHRWSSALSFLVFLLLDHFSSSISLNSLRGSSVSSFHSGSDFDNSGVNAAADTVLHLDVQLRDNILFESSILFEILFGWSVNDVSDGESLDGFVLGAFSSAVDADNGLDMASVVLVSSLISSLLRHCGYKVIFIFN